MNRVTLELTNEEGTTKTFEVIATYHHDENNRDYIIYTDGVYNEKQKLNIFYSAYEKIGSNIRLLNNTIEDKQIGLELIKELVNDLKN